MRQRIFRTYLGGRGGTTDTLFLSGYNCESVVCSLLKIDAGTTGQIAAVNEILKAYSYDVQLAHNDVPTAYYLYPPPDLGFVAHETKTGAAMTISGAGPGIIAGGVGATRYNGQYGTLHAQNAATLQSATYATLTAAENSGVSWTFECWVFQNAATAVTLYLESNLAFTNSLAIVLSAGGVLSVQHSGATAWTAPAAIAAGVWTHVALVFSAGAATVQAFKNGVSMGAASAYTRLGTYASATVIFNGSANNVAFISCPAVYFNVAFVADDALRHYTDMTTDVIGGPFIQTAATVTKNGSVSVLFGNHAAPGYDSATQTIRLPLSPLLELTNNNGIFYVEALFNEYEE